MHDCFAVGRRVALRGRKGGWRAAATSFVGEEGSVAVSRQGSRILGGCLLDGRSTRACLAGGGGSVVVVVVVVVAAGVVVTDVSLLVAGGETLRIDGVVDRLWR